MTFTLRDATAHDYPVFARLSPALGVPDPLLTPEQFATQRLPTVILVEEEGAPIGYAYWRIEGPRAHVANVVVDEAARGRGAGRALMEELRRRVLAAGCSRWSLNVKQDNAPAIHLYATCGFAIEREAWGIDAEWGRLAALPSTRGEALAYAPESEEDPTLAACVGETVERLRALRGRPGLVLRGLREAGVPVAFAAFDPSYPAVHPLRLARVDLAGRLFEELAAHATGARVHVAVDGNAELRDALLACGASVRHAMYLMEASLL